MAIKSIGIIGVGGVGGYFGGKLCHYLRGDKDIKIYFIGRGEHLRQIKKNGLQLSTQTDGDLRCYPELATDNFKDVPLLDLVLVSVKSYDLVNVIKSVSGNLHSESIVLPLLNGIDIYERIRSINKSVVIFPACVYVGTHIEKSGYVTQQGGACKILFTADSYVENRSVISELITIFKTCNINHEKLSDVYPEIWKKYIFISGFGLVTSAYNKTLGQVMESETLSAEVLAVMQEIYKLSQDSNIGLEENIVKLSFEKGRDFPYDTKTSFQRDYENENKPDERDLFDGVILRLGEKHNIDVSVTKNLFSIIAESKPQAI